MLADHDQSQRHFLYRNYSHPKDGKCRFCHQVLYEHLDDGPVAEQLWFGGYAPGLNNARKAPGRVAFARFDHGMPWRVRTASGRV
ncbi:hypothetical protein GCM10027162_66370 [Streptomyces incanus]